MATVKKETEKKTAKETKEKDVAVKKKKVKKVQGKEVKPIADNVDVEQQTSDQTSELTVEAKEVVNEESNPATDDVDVVQPVSESVDEPAIEPEVSAEQEEIEKKAEEETDKLFQSNGIMLGKSDKKEEGEVKTVEDIINTKEHPTEPPQKTSIGKKISKIMQYMWNGQVMD